MFVSLSFNIYSKQGIFCHGSSYLCIKNMDNYIQSTLVISKSKGPSKTVRDIRSSTYQIFRIEENTNCTTKFHK